MNTVKFRTMMNAVKFRTMMNSVKFRTMMNTVKFRTMMNTVSEWFPSQLLLMWAVRYIFTNHFVRFYMHRVSYKRWHSNENPKLFLGLSLYIIYMVIWLHENQQGLEILQVSFYYIMQSIFFRQVIKKLNKSCSKNLYSNPILYLRFLTKITFSNSSNIDL